MKAKYIYRDKNVFTGVETHYKAIVLYYLKGFYPNYATSANIYDYVTKSVIENTHDVSYEYNGYFWTESDIYHFEKYNMPLSDCFVEHILKMSDKFFYCDVDSQDRYVLPPLWKYIKEQLIRGRIVEDIKPEEAEQFMIKNYYNNRTKIKK